MNVNKSVFSATRLLLSVVLLTLLSLVQDEVSAQQCEALVSSMGARIDAVPHTELFVGSDEAQTNKLCIQGGLAL